MCNYNLTVLLSYYILPNMKENKYTLDELEIETQLGKRNIRYYLHEVIGSHQGTKGMYAGYPKSVLDKLLFIKMMRAHNLKLAEIKAFIEATPYKDIVRVVEGKEPLEIVDTRTIEGQRNFRLNIEKVGKHRNVVAIEVKEKQLDDGSGSASDYIRRIKKTGKPKDTTSMENWKVIKLGKDAELRVRGEFTSKQRELLKALAPIVKNIIS